MAKKKERVLCTYEHQGIPTPFMVQEAGASFHEIDVPLRPLRKAFKVGTQFVQQVKAGDKVQITIGKPMVAKFVRDEIMTKAPFFVFRLISKPPKGITWVFHDGKMFYAPTTAFLKAPTHGEE